MNTTPDLQLQDRRRQVLRSLRRNEEPLLRWSVKDSTQFKAQWFNQGGSITVLLTSCLTGLDWSVLQIKTKIFSCYTTNSKPVKQEVNSTVIIPTLVNPGLMIIIY